MKLYHGSNTKVDNPRIIESDRRLDFGDGFYLTSSLEQALRWAKLKKERTQTGEAIVTCFEISEEELEKLNIHIFEKANAKWLKYVSENRQGKPKKERADIVVGPVANDRTMPTIARYMTGDLTAQEALRRLKTQKLKDQYAFKNERALLALEYRGIIQDE